MSDLPEERRPVLARLQHLMTLREEVETVAQVVTWLPPADWRDAGTHLELLLDVPAVLPDSLTLSEDGDEVTVSGERERPSGLLSSERPAGPFSRTLTFPQEVIPNTGTAEVRGGVLTVRFEKVHPTIDVSAELQES